MDKLRKESARLTPASHWLTLVTWSRGNQWDARISSGRVHIRPVLARARPRRPMIDRENSSWPMGKPNATVADRTRAKTHLI